MSPGEVFEDHVPHRFHALAGRQRAPEFPIERAVVLSQSNDSSDPAAAAFTRIHPVMVS